MDIKKVIECLKADKEYLTDMKICDGEEIDIAIKALEEVQQYREIGTLEECRDAVRSWIGTNKMNSNRNSNDLSS